MYNRFEAVRRTKEEADQTRQALIQAGLEVSRFWMIDGRREDIDQGFSGQTVVFQLVNRVAYQGYKLVSRTGLQLTRRKLEDGERQDSNLVFMVINAGLR